MENGQIIGEKLFKGGQYFQKIFKKKGVVLVVEISISLSDYNHMAFQQYIVISFHVQLNDALELEYVLYQNYDKIINKNKVLGGLFENSEL